MTLSKIIEVDGEVGLEGMLEPIVALFGEFGGNDAFEEARERLWGFGGGTGLSEATDDRPEATEDLLLALKITLMEGKTVTRNII